MDCLAHRGFAGVNPENTVTAVSDAVARADGVEVDVRRCGSGELVVNHDTTVDRTTDGSGLLSEFTADELAALRVEGSDAGVPTLDAVLAAVPETARLVIELKERGLGGDVEAAVAATEATPEVLVSSFDSDALASVTGLPRALLVAEAGDDTEAMERIVERATDMDCVALHPPVDDCTSALVDDAHDADLDVTAWTVTDPDETRRLQAAGADGVITDYPACCPSALTDSRGSGGV